MKKYALLIGVEEYQDKMISQLQFARADATALAKRLNDRCDFDDIRVLADNNGEDAPDLINIVTALRDTAGELHAEDLFLFFFAGHGVEKEGHGYLLARDSIQAFPEHGSLSLELLRKTFERLNANKRIILLDACRNSPDAGRSNTSNYMSDAISRDIVAAARTNPSSGTTTILLSACRSGQRAYEWPNKGHGVFTHYLLEGLDGAAWRENQLKFGILASYTTQNVRRWSSQMPGLPVIQEPWYEHFGDPDQVVLADVVKNPKHKSATSDCPKTSGFVKLLEEPKLRIETKPSGCQISIDAKNVGVSPVSVTLPTGQYHIKAEKSGFELWERRISFDGKGDACLEIELSVLPRRKTGDVVENSIGMKFAWIPPGEFLMGSPEDEKGRYGEESLQHKVQITKGLYVGITPVTQAQYRVVMNSNPSNFKGEDLPVESVSWEEAVTFCQKLSNKEGRIYQLPTEAQWEYACRAGTTTRFYFGDYDDDLCYHAWFDGNSEGKTHPVGKKKPNAFGLYDMHGNTWEWCSDLYKEARVEARVLRGGSWDSMPKDCRSAVRIGLIPGCKFNNDGFRVVLLNL